MTPVVYTVTLTGKEIQQLSSKVRYYELQWLRHEGGRYPTILAVMRGEIRNSLFREKDFR